MKVKRKLYGGILCLAVVTALVAVTVKTDLFKYVFAHATLGEGWSMKDDGTIKGDAPDGVEIVYEVRPETSEHPGPYLKHPLANSNGENSEP